MHVHGKEKDTSRRKEPTLLLLFLEKKGKMKQAPSSLSTSYYGPRQSSPRVAVFHKLQCPYRTVCIARRSWESLFHFFFSAFPFRFIPFSGINLYKVLIL